MAPGADFNHLNSMVENFHNKFAVTKFKIKTE